LCNFAFKYLNDSSVAEDAVQDVFVKIWVKREGVDLSKNIKSFLFQSVKNRAIEVIRKNKLDTNYRSDNLRKLEGITDMDDEADRFLMMERIYASIRQLPPKCQKVFTLSKVNGLTYNEIAEELEISVKTVENQIGRSLRILREKLSI